MLELISVKSKSKKRPGRGLSAGQGKTAGRGTKGQKSRAGFNIPKRYEGGQTPLSMRLPKLPGFKSFHKKAVIISLDMLSAAFKDGETVTLDSLAEKNLINRGQKAKVLNNGKLQVKIGLSSLVGASKSIRGLFSADLKTNENTENKIEAKVSSQQNKRIVPTRSPKTE